MTDPDVIRRLEESIVGAEKDIARRQANLNRMRAELTELNGGWQPSDYGRTVLERDGYTATVWESTPGSWAWIVKRGAEFVAHVFDHAEGRHQPTAIAAKALAERAIYDHAEARG